MRFLVSQVRLDFMGRVSPVEKKVYVLSPDRVVSVASWVKIFKMADQTRRSAVFFQWLWLLANW